MKKRFLNTTLRFSICLAIGLFFAQSATAQQTPYISSHRYNWQVINPAAIDRILVFDEDIPFLLTGTFRQQWIGVEGAPTFGFLSFEHRPIHTKSNSPGFKGNFVNNSKWGFSVFGDQTDAIGTYGIYANYAYTIQVSTGNTVHVGISPGFIRYQIDQSKLKFKTPEELNSETMQELYMDFSFGVFYKAGQKFYTGISAPQTFALNLDEFDATNLIVPERKMHFSWVTGGYLTTGVVQWEPSLWFRYVPGVSYQVFNSESPIAGDLNLRLHLLVDGDNKSKMWAGLGGGMSNIYRAEFGFNASILSSILNPSNSLGKGTAYQWRFSLSYDFPYGKNNLNLGHSLQLNGMYSWK